MSGEGIRGVLETALYYPHERREATLSFYEDALGLRRVAGWEDGTAYRLGSGVLLLFDAGLLADREGPIADHGEPGGRGHVCFVAEEGRYAALRGEIEAAGVEITHEHEWPGGKRSFYFKDPAGNLLEVADSDLWPG